jgi:hypothetical protein
MAVSSSNTRPHISSTPSTTLLAEEAGHRTRRAPL